MNREQIWHFLEAYRDGVIDEDAAVELAQTIRAGGPDAEWIVEELTFTGWIQQALQQLDGESFVRSFLERLYAERGNDEFTRAFSRRLAVETQKVKQQQIQESRLRMPFRDLLGSNTNADPADSSVGRAASRWRGPLVIVAAGCVAVIALGLTYLLLARGGPAMAGTFIESSPGVIVLAEDSRRDGKPGGGVAANETVSIPMNGHAVVSDLGNGRWRLQAGAMATFMPLDKAKRRGLGKDQSGIYLQTGVLAGETTGQAGGLTFVTTPHATAEFNDPVKFTISVTSGSTYAEVDSGNIVITRISDGKTVELNQGYYTVAAKGAEFEPLEK